MPIFTSAFFSSTLTGFVLGVFCVLLLLFCGAAKLFVCGSGRCLLFAEDEDVVEDEGDAEDDEILGASAICGA